MATTRKRETGVKPVTQEVKTVVIPPSPDGDATAVEKLNDMIKAKSEAKAKTVTNQSVATVNLQDSTPEPATIPPAGIPTPTFTLEDVQALIRQAAESAAMAAVTNKEQTLPPPDADPEMEALKQELAELKAALAEKHQQEESLENLEAVVGIKGRSQSYNANSLAQFTSQPDKMPSLVKEAFEVIQSAPRHEKNYEDQYFIQPDATVVDEYVKQHILEARAKYKEPINSVKQFSKLPLIHELTEWGKRQGLFKGNTPAASRAINAGVVMDDMVGGFLPLLSSMLRFTHRGAYCFWQFPDVAIDHGRNRGDTIQIARYALNEEPTNDSDWLLSGGGTWSDLTTDSQGTKTGTVDAVIKEYGMGKTGVNANRPYVVPNFVQMYSALSVLQSFSVNIMRNYMQFEDRYIRALWTPTSRVVYNNKDLVETTVGNLDTGSGGQLTVEFLHALYAAMRLEYIPTYADSCYGLVINSIQLEQLRKSVVVLDPTGFTRPSNTADLATLVNILPAIDDIDRITGYRGVWGNFHIFEQNTFAVGAAGTPGVQNVTTADGAKLSRTAYAFGANTIGRGIGMPMEIRTQNGELRWNRDQRFIWISHESFAALDVDPTGYSDTSDVPQQSRVFQVRTLDVAL